jgi:hypothetical protein
MHAGVCATALSIIRPIVSGLVSATAFVADDSSAAHAATVKNLKFEKSARMVMLEPQKVGVTNADIEIVNRVTPPAGTATFIYRQSWHCIG